MNENILKLIQEKGTTAIDVFNRSKETFEIFKSELQKMERELKLKMMSIDPRVLVDFDDKGKLEVHLKVANDEIVFLMQPSVFTLDENHPAMKSSYMRDDTTRNVCGMICIYNFLSDSFKFNRVLDSGLLVARIFINKEMHFIMEGKRQMGLLFNNFPVDVVDAEKVKSIIEKVVIHCLENDTSAPAYDLMQLATVQELVNRSGQVFESGKRFGFVMQSEKGDVV